MAGRRSNYKGTSSSRRHVERNRNHTVFYNSVPPNRLAATLLEMRRISSGGSRPMYHFLFFFPRARAAPRQVSECITVMVTMAL